MSAGIKNHDLSGISGPEFAVAAAANPVVLLPLGSTEDHGPYLPMGDYVTAGILASRIAEQASAQGVATFVAPTLPFGVADYFGSSPGGMAISAAGFRAVLTDLLDGLRRHGLTRIVILNGHGGNLPVIHEVTLQIRLRHNSIIPSLYLWKVARTLMEKRCDPAQGRHFGHGAEPLLSLSRALRPQPNQITPVQENAATLLGLPVSGFGTLNFEGIDIEAPVEFAEVPKPAMEPPQALLGETVAEELIGVAARFIGHYAKAD